VAACCVVAVMLHFGLTRYGVQNNIAYCDGGGTSQQGPSGAPLVRGHAMIGDTFCQEPAAPGERRVASIENVGGLFARGPRAVAIGGGIVLPALLVMLGIVLLLEPLAGRTRSAFAAGLGVLAVAGFALAATRWPLAGVAMPWTVMLSVVLACFFLGEGVWLWRSGKASR
jgi:hypothetical protein